MSADESAGYNQVPALTGRLKTVVGIAIALTVAAGVALRFWTPSALWLDEALTVNIARLPLHEIPARLKQDGAPPLFYYLLHFWMRVFGQSDLATRALAGVFGVLTLPVAWFAAKGLGGRVVAWTTLVLVASAPFAVYYSSESRMYSLVILLTGCGILALQRAMTQPRPGNLIAVGVVTAALLYTQYWSLYLVGSVGVWLVIELFWARRRAQSTGTNGAWGRPFATLMAVVVGCIAFVPWVPTFLYQSEHTGTPWAAPANFAGAVNAVTGFTYNQASASAVSSNQGRVLAIIYLAMAALALFGLARSGRVIELDLHTRPRLRPITFVVVATVLAAIAGGLLTSSAFSSRYTSVVFLPFLIMVALGTVTLLSTRGRLIVVALAVVAGLVVSVQSQHTQRTQAPGVAAVIAAHARPGDIIAFCPDQLGPDTYRVVTDPSQYKMVTFPRGIGPQFIDWVDYEKASRAGNPTRFTATLAADAGSTHRIWLVWEGGYQTFGVKCEELTDTLGALPGVTRRNWVTDNMTKYYEPMNLTEYSPKAAVGP